MYYFVYICSYLQAVVPQLHVVINNSNLANISLSNYWFILRCSRQCGSFLILALLGLVRWSSSAKCPAEYERFSLEHTFCIPRNPRCDIKRSGVTQEDIQKILRLHNQYRSGIALGKETRAKGGTLPKAADMLQMVWDDELAAIAQKWAENCDFNHDCDECRAVCKFGMMNLLPLLRNGQKTAILTMIVTNVGQFVWDDELAAIAQKWAENCDFNHDCDECRAVSNFGVGQNLAIQSASCSNCKEDDMTKPKWADAIKGLYDEVLYFHKSWLDRFQSGRAETYVEHFTQVIWSETWRLGCGYTSYKAGKKYKRFYVCNYGPSGNMLNQPVYKQGQPCSACPVNTCCGSSCKSGPNYPGLCKMLNQNTAPIYQRNLNNLLFHCDSNPKTKDCETQVTGTNKWTNIASLQGNYMSIVLNGGESTTLEFKKQIAPSTNGFCIRFNFRKGPMKAGQGDSSSLKATYKADRSVIPMDLARSDPEFAPYSIDLGWKTPTGMPATVCYFFIFSLVCLLKLTHSQDCPARYMRFTPEHTFCIRRNSKCDIKRSGICQLETEEILRLHNEYRNRVALGKEHRAIGGSLPKAGGMLQMVWDDELAVVAQKWAENCNFNHDCNDCRAVEHFAVGQNLVLQTAMCQGYGCREDTQTEPNWQKMIKGLYEEVTYYHKDWMWSFEDLPGPLTGHFTQMIWSRSWRIGCGYTSFKEGSTYKNFYVCNYGPAGNTGKQPVYEKGEPCSACPINSCCGSSCRGGISYPGLCKMLDPNIPPEYRRPSNLFFCGVSLSDIDCQAIVTGHNNWKNIKSVGGLYWFIFVLQSTFYIKESNLN
ncbi:unnamed protein product [Larinioides sclopetarius]|uniref:SCP domain-containing protein n=1 Tax=Larinioides sclopetarius TaxID=280406 RepID=A0AAV1YQR0_9ARAC